MKIFIHENKLSYALVQTDLNYKAVRAPVQLAQPAATSRLGLKPFLGAHPDPHGFHLLESCSAQLEKEQQAHCDLTAGLVRGEQKFRSFYNSCRLRTWERLFWNNSLLQKKGMRGVRNRKPTRKQACQHSELTTGELLCGKGKKKTTEFQKLHLVMIIPKGFCWVYFAKINMLTLNL